MPRNIYKAFAKKNPPSNWEPLEIVYSRYSFEATARGIRFFSEPSSVVVDMNLQELLAALLENGGANASRANSGHHVQPRPGMAPATPLDILVRKPCLVVVELDPSKDWRFRRGDVALTSKADYENDNCALRHIYADGSLGSDPPADRGCRIIVFAVVRREDGERQSFNFHVELQQQGGEWMEIVIDPDVPNTGGGFPIFE
jgi:hypothetical protein